MNKQEKSKLHRFINDNEFMTTYVGGGAEFETTVVDSQRLRRLIRKMNDQPEHQKVKVPQYVAEWILKCQELNWTLPNLFAPEAFESSFTRDTEEWLRQNKQNYDILARAWLDGYEVEEEPKWVVRVGEKLLFKNFDDNEFPIFVIDDNPGSIQLAENFDLEKKAHNVQKEIGGTVEKV